MFKNILKNAFTLAEVMIVFTVIGILTAILIPTLLTNSPDKEKLKAQKAYNTITRAVEDLLNNGVYSEYDGTLVSTPFIKGNEEKDSKARIQFFCNQLVDHLNVTGVNCNFDNISNNITPRTESSCDNNGSESKFVIDATYQTEYPVCLNLSENNDFFDYGSITKTLDSLRTNFFDEYSDINNQIPQDKFNFKTNDGVLWALQLTNFAHNNIVTLHGVSVPGFHSLACFNTADGAGLENTYCLAIRKDGKIIPDTSLQNIINSVGN